ncbi:hypothetical protein QBC40DRAFT_334098 [Triangularia verruculosa]|uniref:Uncharacterized protein n=1 Tax=Triangularia verruculosa TaxID=2587418 RepID=A0AAN7AQB9_9PEZI|nr:hypothetical protein QBC40DRAFT_334098 [Triangularia verruculosa]
MAVVYGQPPVAMADRELHRQPPTNRHLQGWGQVPEPLHIRKQSGEYTGGSQSYGGDSSRRASIESNATDASFESVPEPPGDHVPLSIPKRRGDPSGQSSNSPAQNGLYQFKSALRPGDVGSNIAPAIPPRSQRRSTSCNAGRHQRARSPQLQLPRPFNPPGRSFRRRGQVLDGSTDQEGYGWRDTSPAMPMGFDGHRLRNARSLFHLARAASGMNGMNGMDSIVEPPRSPIPPEPDSPTSSPDEGPPAPDPLVLVPRIVVTPEHKALDEGAVSLWAAVQLSTQISRANAPERGEHGHEPSPPGEFEWDHGGIGSSIIEVVDDKACAISTLYPGSRLLVVAHVRLLPPANTHRLRRNAHQSSDDLMEDLEHHLGSTMTEYLQVRITYRHSGFPQQQQQQTRNMAAKNAFNDGIANVQTSIQTTAVAVIKRHNSSSPWSPRPRAPQPNPIFEIIASHWGVQSANEVMQRIISSRPPMGRKSPPPSLGPPGILTGGRFTPNLVSPEESGEEDYRRHYEHEESISEETMHEARQQASTSAAPPTRMAPPIPKRQTSLRQAEVEKQQQKQAVQRHLRSETEDIARMIKIGSWPESPRNSVDGGSGEGGVNQTPSSMAMTTPATTSTNRTTYRLSKLRRVPSYLKMSGGGGMASPPVTPTVTNLEGVVEMPRSSTTSASSRAEKERQSYQSSRSYQSSAQSSLGRRRSLGGDGPSSQEGRERGRESRDSRESRGGRSRPSTSGGQGGAGEKMFTSIVRTIESGSGNGNNMGRKASKKERGWWGWSGWWQ